jgi:hypothetical protein
VFYAGKAIKQDLQAYKH